MFTSSKSFPSGKEIQETTESELPSLETLAAKLDNFSAYAQGIVRTVMREVVEDLRRLDATDSGLRCSPPSINVDIVEAYRKLAPRR